MVIGIAALVMIIGALVYYIAEGKASEMGRIAFFCGLLVVLSGAAQVVALIQ